MICPKCTAKIPDGEHICKNCKTDAYTYHVEVSQSNNVPLPMGWFKFLIYFLLFAGAIMNFSNAGNFIGGSQYYYMGEDYSDVIYGMYDSLYELDMFVGISLIVMAAFQIFVRFRLSRFKKDGPVLIIIMYIANIIIPLIYLIGSYIIVGNAVVTLRDIAGMAISVAMCFVNHIYFSNRRNLFIN